MTGPAPFQYRDRNAEMGVESPLFDSEWDAMLERRRQLVEEITGRLRMAQDFGIDSTDIAATHHNIAGENEDGTPTNYQALQIPASSQQEINKLLGAAEYYGIANADKIPTVRLKYIIEQRRLATQQETEGARQQAGTARKLGESVAEGLVAMGLGSTQELLNVAQRLPFVGDAISRFKTIQQAEQYLALSNEHVVAGMNPEEASGFRTASSIGGMVGYALPATAAWKVAGAVGQIGFIANAARYITSPLVRAAIQGAASTAMLETGGDASNEEKMLKVGAGAVGGAAFTYLEGAVPRIFERVRAAFKAKTDPFYGEGGMGSAKTSETVDAEWYFEADQSAIKQIQEAIRLGPGTPPAGAAPAGGAGSAMAPIPQGPNFTRVPGDIAPAAPGRSGQIMETSVPDPSIRLTAPEAAPMAAPTPAPTQSRLMTPEKAAMQERINTLTEQRDVAQRLAETDPLTGGGNKRALMRAQEAVDADPELSWVVFDGRRFKNINDANGHQVGDQVLSNFGRAVQQAALELNVPSRFFRQGGDEFAAVVPKNQAAEFAAKAKELSFQRLGERETWLDAHSAESFAEADMKLMNSKRRTTGTMQAIPEPTRVVANVPRHPNDIRVIAEQIRAYEAANPPGPMMEVGFDPKTGRTFEFDSAQPPTSSLTRIKSHTTSDPGEPDGVYLSYKTREVHQLVIETPGGDVSVVVERTSPTELDVNWIGTSAGIAGGRQNTLGPSLIREVGRQLLAEFPGSHTIRGERISGVKEGRETVYTSRRPNQMPEVLNSNGASAEGATLSKQAVLMEAGDYPKLSGGTEINTADVVQASLAKSPGGISIVRGIGDASKIVRQLVQGQSEKQLMPHTFRFVDREGALDLLVSDGLPITNKRVVQYKEHGFFEGQTATVAGQEVVIKNPGPQLTTVTDPHSGVQSTVNTREVMPGRSTDAASHISETYPKAPELYEKFQAHVMVQMENGGVALGKPEPFDWLGHETSTQLPRMLDEFLDLKGIAFPMQRHAVEAYFNTRRVADYRALAPVEAAELADAVHALNVAAVARPPVEVPIEDIAATKGFSYVTTPGEAGGTLADQLSDLRIPVEDPEGALAFLRAFNREVPSYTPLDEVPMELGAAGPHAANPGKTLDPVLEGGAEQVLSTANRELRRVERDLADVLSASGPQLGGGVPPVSLPPSGAIPGAGVSPPAPPSPPTGPAAPGGPPPPPPPGGVGPAFAGGRPAQLYEVLQKLDSAWLRYGEPFRRATIIIQDALQGIGIEEGALWKHSDAVRVALSQKHNEEHRWMREATDIFTSYNNRKLLRAGKVVEVQTIANPAARQQAMTALNFSPVEQAAQGRIEGFYDRFLSYATGMPLNTTGLGRAVFQYTAQVRARQAMPGIADPYKDVNNVLPPQISFIQELARNGNMQMRSLDARTLTTSVVRAALFEKFVAPSWNYMKTQWDDPKIDQAEQVVRPGRPPLLRPLAMNWLNHVRQGHNPEYDVAIQGVRHVLNKIGVPITDSEVAGFWGGMFSNLYRARQGGRPDIIFRDAISPLLAGTRIGMTPIAQAYVRFLKGGKSRDGMIDRGLKGGWIEEGMVRSPIAEVFEKPIQLSTGIQALPPHLAARREQIAAFGDVLYSLIPKGMRSGLQGTKFDPLLLYTNLNSYVNRGVAGDAGWQVATDALTAYKTGMTQLLSVQQQGPALLAAQKVLTAKLMDASAANVYPMPIQKEFQRLVEAGDTDGAANLMGRESANSQFLYGTKEGSIGVRAAGTVGRAAMTFGSFTQQYVGFIREQFGSHVPAPKRAAMAMRHGSIAAILGLAGVYTGWKFSKWMWHSSLTFAGGPIASAAYESVLANTGRVAEMVGTAPSPQQGDALARARRTSLGEDAFNAAAGFMPYTSTLQTVDRLNTAVTGLNPVEATARLALTGERGLGSDFKQYFDNVRTITPDDLDGAIAGDESIRAKFRAQELNFIDGLRTVPREERYKIWAGYRDSQTRSSSPYPPSNSGARY